MRSMHDTFSSFCRRRALTLIEVLTALAILSTLLVGVLVAFRKNAERIRTELAVRQAVAGVDQLLFSWAQQGLYAPARAEGKLPGSDGLIWQTRVVSHRFHDTLGLDIVRLQVHADRAVNRLTPLVTIELPVPGGSDDPQEQSTS